MRKMFAVLVAAGLALAPVACLPTPGADAATAIAGCPTGAVKKVNPWGHTKNVEWSNPDDPLPDGTVQFRLGAQLQYWYCPNGSDPAMSKATDFGFCATKLDNRDPMTLQGFKWNPYHFTLRDEQGAEKVVNPPQQMLHWAGGGDTGDSHCDGYTIPNDDRVWMYMNKKPAWTLSCWVAYIGYPDDQFDFKAGSDNVRELDPAADPLFDPFG